MLEQTLSNPAPESSRDLIFAINPVSGETIEPGYPESTSAEVDHAVRLATDAYENGALPAPQRAEMLRQMATAIESLGDEVIHVARSETGLPEGRLVGERQRTVNQLRMFAKVVDEGAWLDARIETALPDRVPIPRPDLRSMLVPIGPVAVFGASNFPFAFSTAGGDTASALASGCPVVYKAHPAHPGTNECVSQAIRQAISQSGGHPGTFTHLHGRHLVGEQLVQHPLIHSVAFTGSLRGGRALSQLANLRAIPIPVFAEMGSINPVFLLPHALEKRSDALATEFAVALSMGVGQFCTNPGLVVGIAGPRLDGWKESVSQAVSKVLPQAMLTPEIAKAYQSAGECLRLTTTTVFAASVQHCLATPGVFSVKASEFISNPMLQEEVFGPTCLVVECRDQAELVAVANALQGQLTATLHAETADLELESILSPILVRRVGRLIRNGFPTGVEVGEAMQHGGPYPASTDARFTSVGTRAILRFARPVCFQGVSASLLPQELQDENPLGIVRRVNGSATDQPI